MKRNDNPRTFGLTLLVIITGIIFGVLYWLNVKKVRDDKSANTLPPGITRGVPDGTNTNQHQSSTTARRMLNTIQEGIQVVPPPRTSPQFGTTQFKKSRLDNFNYRVQVFNHLLLKTYYETNIKDSEEFILFKNILANKQITPSNIQIINLFNTCCSYEMLSEDWDKINPELLDDHDRRMRAEILEEHQRRIRRELIAIDPDISQDKIKALVNELLAVRPPMHFTESDTPLQEGDYLLIN